MEASIYLISHINGNVFVKYTCNDSHC